MDEEGWCKTLTKYNTNSDYGTVDNLTTLQPSDDVATQKLGDGARMPTADEWQELIANTTSEWTTMNGVYGRKLTSETDGKSLFLPAAGYRWESELYYAGSLGLYWCSSLSADYPGSAWSFRFDSGDQLMDYYCGHLDGSPVRAVRQN